MHKRKSMEIYELHNAEIERGIIGKMLLSPNVIHGVNQVIQPDDFYNQKYATMYREMIYSLSQNIVPDVHIIAERMRQYEYAPVKELFSDLTDILSSAVTSNDVLSHAYIIKEYSVKRSMLVQAQIIEQEVKVPGSDALQVLYSAEESFRQISSLTRRSTTYGPEDYVDLLTEQIRIKDSSSLIDTGIQDLDRYLGGLVGGDMMTIAARTSIGKTSLAISMAYNLAIGKNMPVGFISLEMPMSQLVYKMVAQDLRLPIYNKIRRRRLDEAETEQIAASLKKIRSKRFVVDDSSSLDPVALQSKARYMQMRYGIKILFIDYMQLINVRYAKSQEERVSTASRACKEIAKELDIPVITLAQLNRESEKDGVPRLSQIRSSDAIAQDSDIVLLIERPGFYGKLQFSDETLCHGKAKLHLQKNRMGSTGECVVRYIDDIQRFEQMGEEDLYGPPPGFQLTDGPDTRF